MPLQTLKTGKNFAILSDGRNKLIKIENVRLSYPAFGKKKQNKDEDTGNVRENWGGRAMLNMDTHTAAKDAFVAFMNELATANEVKIPAEYRPLKDGNEVEGAEFQNHWLINFSDATRTPTIVDRRGQVLRSEEEIDKMFYGGCWANLLLRPWYFNGKAKNSSKTFPKRICCGFVSAQFVKDDEPFGSGVIDTSDVWGAASDDDGDGL